MFEFFKGCIYYKQIHGIDYRVPIRAIVQTGPQKEALKTTYLAELLDLSKDKPLLCSDFDIKEATRKLLQSPIIKEAEVKIKEPGILYIDYTIRQPVAFLLDYYNVALDEEGYPFPVAPFLTPKNLPNLYLGLKEKIEWNVPITDEKIELAFEVLNMLSRPIVKDLFNVKRIDVSNAFEFSLGRREIVLLTEDEIYTTQKGKEVCFILPRLLRLFPKKLSQELGNYLKLREQLLEKEKHRLIFPEDDRNTVYCPLKIIDYRIPQIAFIEEGTE